MIILGYDCYRDILSNIYLLEIFVDISGYHIIVMLHYQFAGDDSIEFETFLPFFLGLFLFIFYLFFPVAV